MASKYLKNENGIVRAITSDNLQLEKPLLNENYDIEVHNRNMDKIDNAIQEVKGKVDGLELTAQRVSIADPTNKFEATNVEDALLENKTSILENKSSLDSLKTKVDNGQNHKLTKDDGTCVNITSQNLNNIVKTGKYVGHTLGNAPYNYWYYVEVLARDTSYIYQKITASNDENITKYERVMRNGTWSNWREL